VDMWEMFAEMWPYVVALVVVLLVVSYAPDLVMWMPRTFGFARG
jgi:TRAP-type C4-dicarboxylate transport system permease large subunit